MAQIGTFTRGDDGVFTGTIRTLTLNVKASIKPVPRRTTSRPATGSPPAVWSLAPAGSRPPRNREPNTSRSSSTTPPSPLQSMQPYQG